MSSEINRVDVLSDELIAAPLKLAKDFDILYASVVKLKDLGKNAEVIATTAKASSDLADSTKQLATAQTELDKVQKQFAASTQKLGDEYISNKRALNEINAEVKKKIDLGDRDSQSVNAQNASYKQLGAALAANRKLYQDLGTEQQRNSKQGQELLKIIQSQDKEFKGLADQMKITNVHVGDYARGQAQTGLAMEALDKTVGGSISSFKALGTQLLALTANPFILAAAGLVATFELLKDAADKFYTRTLEGEDALREEQYKDEAFAASYEKGWAESGEKVAGTFSKLKSVWRDYIALLTTSYNFKALDEAHKKEEGAIALGKEAAKLFLDHAKDRIDDANTELASNEAIDRSKNKLAFTDKERLESLRKSNQLLEDQLQGDLELADADTRRFLHELSNREKLSSYQRDNLKMSVDEMKAADLNGEEITKLTMLQEARTKLESAAADKRAGFHKRESALIQEMQNEEKAAATERERQAKEDQKLMEQMTDDQKAAFEQEKKNEEEAIKLKKKHDDEIVASNERAYNTMITDITSYYEELNKKEEEKKKKTLKDIEDEEEARRRLIKTLQDYADIGADAAMVAIHYQNAVSQNKIQNYQTELAALNDQTAKELQAAGDNENAKAKIQADAYVKAAALQKKIAEEKNKQARLQHQADIIQGGVTFAKAILEALSGAPPPFNLTLAAITAAVAGVQLAAIVASPVPHYETGTSGAPGGMAIVGEKGFEAIKEPGKPWALTPGVATMTHVAKNAIIIPHEETVRALALGALASGDTGGRQDIVNIAVLDDERIVQGLERIIKSQPDIVAQACSIYKVLGERDKNRKWIRAKTHGA